MKEGWTDMCCALCLVTQSCLALCDLMDCSPPGSSVYGGFSGKNTRVGCHVLLQGLFPTQGLNPCLLCFLHWQAGSLPLEPLGNPTMHIYLSSIYIEFQQINKEKTENAIFTSLRLEKALHKRGY